MQIGVLGPLEVRTGSGAAATTVDVGGSRLRTLLILLALQPGRTLTTRWLIAGLWGDSPPAAALGALQALVSRLRRAVPGLPLEFRSAGYRLALPAEAIDAVRFEQLIVDGRGLLRAGDPARAAELLRAALDLWRGAPLADVADAPFALTTAARLEECRHTAIEGRAEAALLLGGGAELVAELAELVTTYPLRESATAVLMRALCAAGRPGDALDAYERLRARLADELGVDPSAELRALHSAVLLPAGPGLLAGPGPPADLSADARLDQAEGAGRPAGADPPAGGAGTGAREQRELDGPLRTNLRTALTSFVGRSRDAEQVQRLVRGARLVTLVGPGGAGKTRLAVETGRRLLADDWAVDGVWLVELAPIMAGSDIPQAVFAALNLREQVVVNTVRIRGGAEADPVARLVAALAGRRMLLVLDNCEHLLDPAAALMEEVLGSCPGVRVLATSREPLAITGETLWPVEPLGLPPAELAARASIGSADAESIARYPAVRLFTDRAAAVQPGFEWDGQVTAIVRICRALDGMPLAIELAAARLRAMTPEQVAARLDDRFRLLSSGSRTALPRHRTLAAVVAWSWDLLDEPERVLWCRLSIFAGGVTADSARAVCAAGLFAGPLDPDDVPDLLTALVEKSLLVTDARTGRYRQLETIREYGLQRLDEAGERARLRTAHADYFLDLAETAEPHLRGHEQIHWLRRLVAEQDNLHAALHAAVTAGDADTAVRMAAALGWYWWLRGGKAEGAQLAEAALDVPGETPAVARTMAGAIAALNAVDGFQDVDRALRLMRRVPAEAEHTDAAAAGMSAADVLPRGSPPMISLLRGFGIMLEGGSATDRALQAFRDCFDLPDPWTSAVARVLYAYLTINVGDRMVEAERSARAALAAFTEIGDRWGMAISYGALGEVSVLCGEHAAAVAAYRRAGELMADLDSTDDTGQFQSNLVFAALALGDRALAESALEDARRSAQRAANPELHASVAVIDSCLARFDGDLDRALAVLLPTAAQLWPQAGAPQLRAWVASAIAHVELALGRLDSARMLLAAALGEAVRSGDSPVIARVLVAVADLALHDGAAPHAAELLGAAVLVSRSGDQDHDRVLRRTRSAVDEATFAAAYARGQAVELTRADELARLPPLAWPPPLPA
ncbi:BTAD domain-containing putative transcriptional regulator [Frankia sp. AiPa1]|uniref:AfsR/SARP family transcriptional regulator n=1 Tax=Frankia sp. AiPa1 TaxID=573492 RepID=UPI00202B7611|nr:BTAD domain-containing putative transcriptional regulator [Frankia sp. AiPa1]MCL9762179.1 hypothetical protein [Frankia sp. AiPa1]